MEFDREKVSGFILSLTVVNKWLEKLSTLAPNEIRALSNVTEGRADILLAGTLLLSEFMRFFGFREITVTERGVRYGLALREWERQGTRKKEKG
jgi:exopolyphosphatase/guanosine-5'-triphosphate,3'-diphosphate pyrophosphatase